MKNCRSSHDLLAVRQTAPTLDNFARNDQHQLIIAKDHKN